MKCLTKHAIKVHVIAVKLIIKLLKNKIVPVSNNTKATIENKITKLTQFIITEVVVVLCETNCVLFASNLLTYLYLNPRSLTTVHWDASLLCL